MPNYCFVPFLIFIFFSLFLIGLTVQTKFTNVSGLNGTMDSTKLVYDISLVVDVNTKMGAMANICLSMALSDFYAKNPNYETRLSPQRWESLDAVGAVSAEIGFVPQISGEASFALKLGDNPSPSDNPFLIRTSMDDFSRLANATISTLEMLECNEVILIYEESMEFNNAIIPYLTNALDNKGIQLSHKTAIQSSAQGVHILEQLELLFTLQSKVFVVHMSTNLASRFFAIASNAGMMSKGFTWLVIPDDLSLSNFVDNMDPIGIDAMKGVIGLRPYVPKTKALENFRSRYKRLSMIKHNMVANELNLFGLRVYDIVWRLAMSVERIGLEKSGLLNTSFRGLGGEFDLVNGKIQPSVFEVLNITDKGEKMIGYWTHENGISRNKLQTRRTLAAIESNVMWKIWVPIKTGFKEFVDIQPGNEKGYDDELPGFSIEVFHAVWKSLDFPPGTDYRFHSFNRSYDELCRQLIDKQNEAAVGDISIVSSRTKWVDFTLPYLESGVVMLIKVRHDGSKDMWIFLKPFSWDLWLVIIAICVFIGIIVRVLDRRENTEFSGTPRNQLSTILMFPCLSVAIPQRDMVVTHSSRLVLVVWILLAFILMQSFTANLSSILTLNQLQPNIPTMKQLSKSNVGYQNGSFVKDFLINEFGFKESMLKPYASVDDYQEALSKGSENGGVSAIFDDIPCIKLFLAHYTTGYQMVGPTYRTDGLGFALPIGSPLVANFSRAILNFTQSKYMDPIEKKYFGRIAIDQDGNSVTASATPSLTAKSFAGLFIIISVVVFLALLISEYNMLRRVIRRYIFHDFHDISESSVQPTADNMIVTNPSEMNNIQDDHTSNMKKKDDSSEEVALEVHPS